MVGKSIDDISIAIINEAYTAIDIGRDQTWLINELMNIKENFKGTLAFVNLRAYDIKEIEKRLEFADLIYIVGGSQIILPELFKSIGFDELLKELAERKVIMGTSAGANVLGRQIEDPNYWLDQYDASEDYLTQKALGLVDFNILPHFDRADHPRRNRKILEHILSNTPFSLYGLTDTQAVIYNEGSINFVGGEPVVFGQAHE